MPAGIFHVVVPGRTLPGTSADQAVDNFVTTFRVPLDRARSLIGRRVVVKRDIDEFTASAYVAALQKAGFEAFYEFSADLPPTAAPATNSTAAAAPLHGWAGEQNRNPVFGPLAAGPVSTACLVPVSGTAPHTAPYDMNRADGPVVQSTGIEQFVQSLGLAHLLPLFVTHSITKEMLVDLTDQDLQSVGITSLGDRKRILGAVRHIGEDERARHAISINEETERAGKEVSRGLLIIYGVIALLVGLILGSNGSAVGFFLGAPLAFLFLWIFFLPTQIAFRNQIEYRWAIAVGNLFFGATVLGWVILLVLAKRLVTGKTAAAVGIIGAIAGRM